MSLSMFDSLRRWLLLGLAIILLAASGVATYVWLRPGSPPVPEIPLDDGLANDKELVALIAESRAAVSADPQSADAWGKLGRVLLANEIFPDISDTCFRQAERLEPDNPRWPYFIGVYLSANEGKPQDALPKFRRAVALADAGADPPTTPRLWLAETLLTVGQVQEAAGLYEHVLEVEPKNPRALFGLGMVAYARADWKSCRQHLEACVANPQAAHKASTQLAAVCERLEDRPSAQKYAQRAAGLRQDIDWADPYARENLLFAVRERIRYRRVDNLEAQEAFGDAVKMLELLVKNDPNNDLPHLMLGKICGRIDDLPKAEEHLRKARQLAPQKMQCHYLLGLALYYKGAKLARAGQSDDARAVFEESVQSLRQALAIQPDYGHAYMGLGLALKDLGKHADAIAAFRQAVLANPEKPENHLFLGQELAKAGNAAEARRCLEEARRLDPIDPRAQAELDKLSKSKN
jgi:tetratricopeptide (TPR) repeat protein